MNTEFALLQAEVRLLTASARLDFLREALPLARNDEDFALVKSISEAIGEVSADEAMTAFRRVLAERHGSQERVPK